jgi:hypothetical protein
MIGDKFVDFAMAVAEVFLTHVSQKLSRSGYELSIQNNQVLEIKLGV